MVVPFRQRYFYLRSFFSTIKMEDYVIIFSAKGKD